MGKNCLLLCILSKATFIESLQQMLSWGFKIFTKKQKNKNKKHTLTDICISEWAKQPNVPILYVKKEP